MEGIFAVNKPRGMNSHNVVSIVRRRTGVKRVGHGGTLDPLAEGVLVIAVGRENTKKLNLYVKGDKEYEATIKLGFNSTTDDEEGEKTEINVTDTPTTENIENVLKEFVGKISQTPPIYSSIKIKGLPAHRRVRRGQEVKLEARMIEIKNIELVSFIYPIVVIRVTTGPGVYIRSLARDIGVRLKTGGYLMKLIRTRVAEFKLESAIKLEES